ncbi:UNVERIFIED_CONTAM: hypothetical protein NCL1_15027 [Trichonephila clavipes]
MIVYLTTEIGDISFRSTLKYLKADTSAEEPRPCRSSIVSVTVPANFSIQQFMHARFTGMLSDMAIRKYMHIID